MKRIGMPLKPHTRLHLRIDRLRLPFQRAAQRRQMADTLRQELEDLFARTPQAPLRNAEHRQAIKVAPVKRSRPLTPEDLGREVARRIYDQCTRGDRS